MSAAIPERVELDQVFPLFPHGAREIKPPRPIRSLRDMESASQGPSLF